VIKNNTAYKIIALSLWLGLLTLSTKTNIAQLAGSFRFMLSGINIVMPIAGALCGLGSISLIFSGLWLLKAFVFALPITVGIPSFFGMASWSSAQNKETQPLAHYLINLAMPLMCMAIFMMHPASQGAWPYAFYWTIPAIIACQNRSNAFLFALQSTFIMHAVGSIMWLFLVPMTSAQWLALIPVVAIERLSMAILTTAIYFIITKSADSFASCKIRS